MFARRTDSQTRRVSTKPASGGGPGRNPWGRRLRHLGALLLPVVVGACPLLVGSVHPPAVTMILVATAVAFLLTLSGEAMGGGVLKGQAFSVFFMVMVLLALLQVVPWPVSWRAAIDPAGVSLLQNAPGGLPAFWPLSLDPVSTREEVGTAAAALAVFALALHQAAGRRYRKLVVNAIAFAGLIAVANGIAHRIFGIDRLFGLFNVFGSVFPGPFINPNHSAEIYEIAAFCALALAMEADGEVRVGWFVAAGVNAAAALTTLSRGSMLGLVAGAAAFLVLRLRATVPPEQAASPPPVARTRRTFAWSMFALGCLISVALALGASPVVGEVANTNLMDGTEKVIVWKDSLSLIARHPLGIGRHAFDRVYPAYKTLTLNSRFQFVENAPLQLLIDVGWGGLLLIVLSLLWLARKLPRRWDDISAALVGGLVAVAAHNLVDFGFETMGIRLPFAAVAGVVIGRAHARSDRNQRVETLPQAAAFTLAALVLVGMFVGLRAQAQPTAEKLEEQWKKGATANERRRVALAAGALYPTDFYFPLLQSYDEPIRVQEFGSTRASSPRLAALNRAMRLCPTCSFVHEQAARSLQNLGLRAQALSSFRDTVRLAPTRLGPLLVELAEKRYSPAELATLAVGGGEQAIEVAKFLVPQKAALEVTNLLSQAEQEGVPAIERQLVRAQLALALGKHAEARAVLAEVRRVAPTDGRSYELGSLVAEQEGDLERALTEARSATTVAPFVVGYARRRVSLVLQLRRWPELDDALERFKIALRQNGHNVTEVHMLAGFTHEQRGNLGRALSEFRIAATLDSDSPAAWGAIARVSEKHGDLSGTVAAYQRMALLQPTDPSIKAELQRLKKAQADARLKDLLP